MALSGLESYLKAIENQLEFLKKQHAVQLKARLDRDRGWMHEEDIEDETYRVTHLTDELFPRLFRGAGLVTIWAVFESSVTDWADHAKAKVNQEFALDELRIKGGDFLINAEKYFERVLQIPLFPDQEIRKDIKVLKALRTAFVHDNGRVNGLPQELQDGIEDDNHTNARFKVLRDWKREYILPTDDCLLHNCLRVTTCLQSLGDRILAKVHPKSE